MTLTVITWRQSIHWLYVKLAPLYQIISDCCRRTWVRETIWPWVLAWWRILQYVLGIKPDILLMKKYVFSSAYSRHHISPSMSYFVYFFNNLREVHFQHTCSTSERDRRSVPVRYWAKEHGNNLRLRISIVKLYPVQATMVFKRKKDLLLNDIIRCPSSQSTRISRHYTQGESGAYTRVAAFNLVVEP